MRAMSSVSFAMMMKTIALYLICRWSKRRKKLDSGQIVVIFGQQCLRFVFVFNSIPFFFCFACRQWHNFCVVVTGKTKFQYTVPGVGPVCRTAWLLTAGFGSRNSRVENVEAKIRRGDAFLPKPPLQKFGTSRTLYAEAFLGEYILANSQRSPVTNDL